VSSLVKPDNAEQVADAIREAAAAAAPFEVVGHGSKRGYGRPVQAARQLDLSGLAGIVLYEPEELVLTCRAGTALADLDAGLRKKDQQLDFEPADLSALYGGAADRGTIGGVLACNLSGPRRLKAGAARDHFLGFKAVSGRGEAFQAGGRVVKNVTGYDLCKLLAGSQGTLAVLTEVTLKVMPAPEKARTILLYGLSDGQAISAMSRALNSEHDVSGAAHLPAAAAARSAVDFIAKAGGAVTAVRVEGHGPSVEHRCAALRAELSPIGQCEELHSMRTGMLWREIRDVAPLLPAGDHIIWRLSVPPSSGAAVVEEIRAEAPRADCCYDWGGGLIWLSLPPSGDGHAGIVRTAAARAGGSATLMRAPDAVRAAVPVFHPQPAALAALSGRVKDAFDPLRILNPGRISGDL
jgi:glycolate oxidase FAD binding subunit